MRTCEVAGCGRKMHARSMCSRCYHKWKWRLDPEASRAKDRVKYAKSVERYQAKNRRFREANPERTKELWAEWYARPENAELSRARSRQRRADKPEEVAASFKRWAARNPECIAAVAQRRRARKREAAGSFTKQEWQDRCREYGNQCPRCKGTYLKLTIDHIVPLSKGGTNYIWNLQPLCGSCNSSKRVETKFYPPPWYRF